MNRHLRFAGIFTLAIAVATLSFTAREGWSPPFAILASMALIAVWILYILKTRKETPQ